MKTGTIIVREFYIKDWQKTPLPLAVWESVPNVKDEPLHCHDCYEIMFVLNGAGFCTINEKHYSMVKDYIFLIKPGDIHSFKVDIGTRFFNILFTEEVFEGKNLFNNLCLLFRDEPAITFSFLAEINAEKILYDIAEELRDGNVYCEAVSKSLFLCFIVYLLRYNQSGFNTKNSEYDLKLSRVFNYINVHICEKILLEQLSRIAGYKPKYFSKMFKNITGVPVSEYIIRRRIELARNQLLHSNKSLSELAYELGFFDLTHFSKTFTRIFGITPSRYRQYLLKTKQKAK